jgi:hypothetical protein
MRDDHDSVFMRPSSIIQHRYVTSSDLVLSDIDF